MENLEVQLIYGDGNYHIYRIAINKKGINVKECKQNKIKDNKISFNLITEQGTLDIYLDLVDGKFKL